jgi:hypothetical protein
LDYNETLVRSINSLRSLTNDDYFWQVGQSITIELQVVFPFVEEGQESNQIAFTLPPDKQCLTGRLHL